jgi:hypothetical protein
VFLGIDFLLTIPKNVLHRNFEFHGRKKMKVNLGESDCLLRILIGTVLLALACTDQLGMWGWISGALLVFTGTTGFCGVYAILGLKSCKDPHLN